MRGYNFGWFSTLIYCTRGLTFHVPHAKIAPLFPLVFLLKRHKSVRKWKKSSDHPSTLTAKDIEQSVRKHCPDII